jgi:predicted metal-dependent hydrolase
MTVSGVSVAVVRKPIKNLHLGVYPPDGRVRVAVPVRFCDAAVRVAVIGKLRWIRRQQAAFAQQARQGEREMVEGETHFYLGRRYRLRVVEAPGAMQVSVRGRAVLELRVPERTGADRRKRALQDFYRERLRELIPPLLEKWQPVLGVQAADWGIKRMKTRWGTCNAQAKRIWLNLELAKKPPECLEYLVVHELVHLIVRQHDERFHALMDRHLPHWKHTRRVLNAAPLAHHHWDH